MDAERILGALVRDALMGGRGLGRHRRHHRRAGGSLLGPGMRGMLGMGALGVAIAAFDHYRQQQKGSGTQSFAGGAPGSGSGVRTVPPPPPPAASSASSSGAAPAIPLPPLPPPPSSGGKEQEALLLIQAMIAAANADYELDAGERERIVRTLEESGLAEAERSALLAELERPVDMATLVAKATTPALRRDVYLASEMAIEADTKAEQNYLARLAKQLGLDDAAVEDLRRILAVSGTDDEPT